MSYIKPKKVISPKARWEHRKVILEGTSGKCSYAIGVWDKKPSIAYRWNGTIETQSVCRKAEDALYG